MIKWIKREPFESVLFGLIILMLLIGFGVMDKRGPLHCTFYAQSSPYCR